MSGLWSNFGRRATKAVVAVGTCLFLLAAAPPPAGKPAAKPAVQRERSGPVVVPDRFLRRWCAAATK